MCLEFHLLFQMHSSLFFTMRYTQGGQPVWATPKSPWPHGFWLGRTVWVGRIGRSSEPGGVLAFIPLPPPLGSLQTGCSLDHVLSKLLSGRGFLWPFLVSRFPYLPLLPPLATSGQWVPSAVRSHTTLLPVASLILAHSFVNRSCVKHSSNYSLKVCHLFPPGILLETLPLGIFQVTKIYIIGVKTFPLVNSKGLSNLL